MIVPKKAKIKRGGMVANVIKNFLKMKNKGQLNIKKIITK